ncbi:zinc finger A20 and AN1 domain-containing stress-associated protein 8-like [Primulina huaijiensis]|uniref:zinc finger A20 and AN1 domain-containing stress-associated protein 8-like n=1 Tax=Primulina huaijiensis TaxID=1492673 RepID=UPI003CC71ECB
MEHDETGFQPPLEGPILCVNNCGFFGSAGNMNMCSKCYKDQILKQEQAKIAASSLKDIVTGTSSDNEKGSTVAESAVAQTDLIEVKTITEPSINASNSVKEGPSRCGACKKRVGLTGFNCRCGNVFCGLHRYSDKHECPFDYRTEAQDAIAKANPIIKAEKLDKI